MPPIREEDHLRASRRELFDAFPGSSSCEDLLAFQRRLVHELIATEVERKASDSEGLREHHRMVRFYGDALAFKWLSVHAIRQLARNTGKPPSLSAQGPAFKLAMDCCTVANERGGPTLLADVTNVLKNGDLVICTDPDRPRIVECKLSAVKDARFERQGRRGRQGARIESIGNFLMRGRGRFFGGEHEVQTVLLGREPEYDFDVVNELVRAALDGRASTRLVSHDHFYSAAPMGETAGNEEALRAWGLKRGEDVAIGNAWRPLEGAWPDIRPPMLWDLPDAVRWALMEGDVSLAHMVRVDAFVGLRRGNIEVKGAAAAPVDRPAGLSWGYELDVAGEAAFIGPNLLLQVVYAHETVESAGRRLLELAERAFAGLPSSGERSAAQN